MEKYYVIMADSVPIRIAMNENQAKEYCKNGNDNQINKDETTMLSKIFYHYRGVYAI